MWYANIAFVLVSVIFCNLANARVTFSMQQPVQLAAQEYRFIFDVTISPDDGLYHDYLQLSVDNSDIQLGQWQMSAPSTNRYDTHFKETKKIYTISGVLSVDAQVTYTAPDDAHIHINYYTVQKQKMEQKIFPLSFTQNNECCCDYEDAMPTAAQSDEDDDILPSFDACSSTQDTAACRLAWSQYISDILSTTDSSIIRFLLALILGLLLSLTPCIYPMIPITIGIIQSQAQRSVLRNFALSVAYSMGISVTYALLGMLAAYTGQKFGTLLINPFVVGSIVILLCYLALSMIGLYEMYIPRFLQTSSHHQHRGGPFLSAFLFGIMSGTVASPCLSPGLILLLTIATRMANKFMGFILLFAFSIGLSIPLLIIGTFSGSLALLPHAGMWMVHIKQFFGFIMLGMCIYFLKPLLPVYMIYGLSALLCISAAIFCARIRKTLRHTRLYSLLIIILTTFGTVMLIYAIKSYFIPACTKKSSLWNESYRIAAILAQQQHKLVLVNVHGPCCSICDAIDRKIFTLPTLRTILAYAELVHLELGSPQQDTQNILNKYHILGAPTILLLDPTTGEELHRWDAKLYDSTSDALIAIVTDYAEKHTHMQ